MDKRTGPPVPTNLEQYLNQVQMKALTTLMQFGWELWFVRRPLLRASVTVVRHIETHQVAVIDINGEIITDHGVRLRGHLAGEIGDTTEIKAAFTPERKKDL